MTTRFRTKLKSRIKHLLRSTNSQPLDQEANDPTRPQIVLEISENRLRTTQPIDYPLSLSNIDLPDTSTAPVRSPPAETYFTQTLSVLDLPIDQNNEHEGWNKLRLFSDVLNNDAGRWGLLKEAIDVLTLSGNRKDYHELKVQLNALFGDLCEHFATTPPFTITQSITNLEWSIKRETRLIEDNKQQIGTGPCEDAQQGPEEVLERYKHIQESLQRLARNTNPDLWGTADEMLIETRLCGLPNSSAACYDSSDLSSLRRYGCTPNTRIEVLEQLSNWAYDPMGRKICWLNGMAGTGKTTIAHSFCELLRAKQRLAASFFCSRQLPECCDANRIVPSIAYQLSCFSRPFRHAISSVLETNPDVYNQSISGQFKQLVVRPVDQVKDALPTNLVVIIDALDECVVETGLHDILDVLLSHAHKLPIAFLVTSRPGANILNRMRSEQGESVKIEMRLHEIEHSVVQRDIQTFLHAFLGAHLLLSPADLDTLLERSGGSFIYAATVVRYVVGNNFARKDSRLAEVLRAPGRLDGYMDSLYTLILQTAFNDPVLTRSDEVGMLKVLHTVVCVRAPVSLETMAILLGLDSGSVYSVLVPFFSVLQISGSNNIVTTFHESFPNYLFDVARSGIFHCNAEDHHTRLVRLCFDQISIPNPPFNICQLKSSCVFDKDIPGLDEIVEKSITGALLYACRYWGVHLRLANYSQELASMLHRFLSTRLLMWAEVMNIKGYINDGVKLMDDLKEWSRAVEDLDHNFRALIEDSRKFIAYCASTPVQFSTPHIYVSALSFWPASSPLGKIYVQRSPHLIGELCTSRRVRKITAGAIIDTQLDLHCLAYSPDGKYIVSGCEDTTVRIWNAHTGQLIDKPLEGHADVVSLVSYSPDGKHIVSSSDDGAIYIWEALTGQPTSPPLRGPTPNISSISNSPNGKHVASGSWDNAIHILDVITGRPVGQPLKSHTASISSIAYSPDCQYIVSGSHDTTIRIWDASTGQPIGQQFEGHTQAVTSVVYSPSGKHIASGSYDGTIRIWDVLTGQLVVQPLGGHTGRVNSVAYSPDGKYIAYTSHNNTIRIWDVLSDQPIDQLQADGHGMSVGLSVNSPNGKDIAFSTIPFWDSQLHQVVDNPKDFETHICSSACQIDGNHKIWTLDENGWVVVDGWKLLVWVPYEFWGVLVWPQNIIPTSSQYGALYLDFDRRRIGEHWAEHFMPLVSNDLLEG